ncbi:hypothetical protein HYT91_00865 [Candidatus Pacearchaeota archaeon]|nr:hypothetical protein [Candidatus Pacearchaeota archaeon]
MAKRAWIFIIYLIVALYIANIGFEIVKLPDFLISINKLVLLVAAVFILIESFKYLREYPVY